MNRKLRPTTSAQQIKDEQIGLMLEEIEHDIEQYIKTIETKNSHLLDLKNYLKSIKKQLSRSNKRKQAIKTIYNKYKTTKTSSTTTTAATTNIFQTKKL